MTNDKRDLPRADKDSQPDGSLRRDLALNTLPRGSAGTPTLPDPNATPTPGSLPPGGALEFRKLIGEGGMGRVYLAYEPSLDRELAVKELAAGVAEQAGFRAAFIREARTTARLDHPGIVPIHTLTSGVDGRLAFTMQALDGQSLYAWMLRPEHRVGSQERLEQGIEILLKVCDALAYAHSRKILHCDLKPDNVMVGEYGIVHLMDWGLAIPFDHKAADGICGTPAYMAPEQARNEPLDVRSDVFGVGAILYELVSGKVPYGALAPQECIPRAVAGEVVDIHAAVTDRRLSPTLGKIVARAVAPLPADRYPTVMALRQELHNFLLRGFHLPRTVVKAGTMLVNEGDSGDSAYVLLDGHCEAFRKADPEGTPPRRLAPGDIFGELALLLGGRRTASVRAAEDCVVLEIDREILENSGALEGWVAALMRALARRFQGLEEHRDLV
jgi:serine/threonine-protein kinase